MSQDTGVQRATVGIASALAKEFKKYTRHAREAAWDNLTSREGRREVAKLLQNPSRPLNTFRTLSFKEWILS